MAEGSSDALLRRLEWTVIRRLDGVLQGNYKTLFRGAGLDFADLREYHYEDDVRHIDWNVTARLQVPHVRQFTEDRELTAWFVLDLSGSVDFGSGTRDKREVAIEFVSVLARLLTRHGNRAGAIFYGSKVEGVLQPGSSRLHVLNLLQRMRNHRNTVANKNSTQLETLLLHSLQAINRRSMIFLVSDFLSAPGWIDALGRLAARNEVVAVRLYDPLEMTLPDIGYVTIEDAETGEQLFIDTQDARFRERFDAAALAHESGLRSALSHAGVDTLEIATDDDLSAAVLRFAEMRRRRRGLSSASPFAPHLTPQASTAFKGAS